MRRARPDERPSLWMLGILSRTPRRVYLSVVLPVAVVMAATALQPWFPPTDLVRDSQVVAAGHGGTSPAYGLISNLGIVVLALSCGGAAIGRLILRDTPGPWPRLVLWSAGLSLVLVLDDLLLLHEAATFAPWAAALVAAMYGFAFLRFVLRFWEEIVRELDVGLLVLAVGSFGVAAATDLMMAATPTSVLVEDGAKLLGIVAWSVFGLRTVLVAFEHSSARPGAAQRPPSLGRRSSRSALSASGDRPK